MKELFGTFWLVLGGGDSAVLASAFPDVGIGLLGVSLAFGLTLLNIFQQELAVDNSLSSRHAFIV